MPTAAPTAAEQLGSLIRQVRRLQHRSQDDLAADTGLSQSAISCYEQGGTEPSFQAVVLIACSLGLDIRVLAEPYRSQAQRDEAMPEAVAS